MKPILTNSGPNIELNALFFQPTRWCNLNCKDCYVKDHEGGEEDFHTPWEEQWRLFKSFYNGSHWANQITISIDDLHKDPTKRHHMVMIVDSILEELKKDTRPKENRPEVHFTFHTHQTFLQYQAEGIKGWEHLDLVSFSEMTISLRALEVWNEFNRWAVPINYNHMVPENFNSQKERERLWLIGTNHSDYIYLVMKKQPIGSPDKNQTIKLGQNHWDTYQLYISEVVDKLPDNVRRKVSIDGCVSDTIKYTRTGFGCSSNVSRVQIWPDGSVSGCPYAFRGTTEIGKSAQDILDNIKAVRKSYEFKESCYLPSLDTSIDRRPKLRIIQS